MSAKRVSVITSVYAGGRVNRRVSGCDRAKVGWSEPVEVSPLLSAELGPSFSSPHSSEIIFIEFVQFAMLS